MKMLIYVLSFGILSMAVYAENQDANKTMVLTKFQQRAIKIKKMNNDKEEEARKLEEDGFCPCSVQVP